MPSAGLLHSYDFESTCILKYGDVSMPSAGLLHSYLLQDMNVKK